MVGFDESILSTIYKETLWISLWQKDRGLSQNMPHFSSPASHDEAQDLPDAASSAMKDMSTMIRGLGGKQTHFRY